MTIDPEKVQEALKQLDGSVRSAVKLLTGLSDEKLTELGGFSEEDSNCAEQQDESGLTHSEAWEAGYQAAVNDAVAKERVTQSQGVEAWGVTFPGGSMAVFAWQEDARRFQHTIANGAQLVRGRFIPTPESMLGPVRFDDSTDEEAKLIAAHNMQLAENYRAQVDSADDEEDERSEFDKGYDAGVQATKPPGDISMALHCVVYPGPDGRNGRRYWTEVGADAAATVDIAAGQRWESGRWYREAVEAAPMPAIPTDPETVIYNYLIEHDIRDDYAREDAVRLEVALREAGLLRREGE